MVGEVGLWLVSWDDVRPDVDEVVAWFPFVQVRRLEEHLWWLASWRLFGFGVERSCGWNSESVQVIELLGTPLMGSRERLFQRRYGLSFGCFRWSGLWLNREHLG